MAHIKSEGTTRANGSLINATFLMVKGFIGTGVLFLAHSFTNAGLISSLVLLVVMASFSLWGMWLLFKASLVIPGSYQDIVGELYGAGFKRMVMLSLAFCQYGFVMVYFLFVASNVSDLISTMTDCTYQIKEWAILISVQLIVYVPLVLIRNIQNLAKFAALANVLMLSGIIFVIINSIIKINSGKAEIKLFNNISDTSLFLGTAIFTYEGFGLVVPISQSMKNPSKFGTVLTSTIIIVSILYILIGTLGYSAYGIDTETVILLNMPNNWQLKAIQFGYVIAVMLSMPLQFFPAIEILESPFFTNLNPNEVFRSAYRIFLTICAAFGAYLGAKSLDVFVSFIGAFCGMPVSFIYPPMIYLRSCAKSPFERWSCYFLLLFGVLVTVFASGIAFQKLLYGEYDQQIDRCATIV